MIATGSREMADKARALRNHGQDATKTTVDFIMPGLNYRMTEFQAVLGNAALGRLRDGIETRKALAGRYDDLLADCVEVPHVPDKSDPVYQSYVVLLPGAKGSSRDGLIAEMRDAGVEATIGTWSIPTTTFYRTRYGYDDSSFPVSSDVFARSLAIPLHERLSADDQSRVAEVLRAAVDR